MSKFKVVTNSLGGFISYTIEAGRFDVCLGALAFSNGEKPVELVASFAPNVWTSVIKLGVDGNEY